MPLPKSWSDLGHPHPTELVEVRLGVHAAVQPVAAAAYALGTAREDHSHSNLRWDGEAARLLGRPLEDGTRPYLDLGSWQVGLLGEAGESSSSLELDGLTLGEALTGFGDELRRSGRLDAGAPFAAPPYDLPFGPERRLERPEPEGRRELGGWFTCATRELAALAASSLGDAELRGWPHHLDFAALHLLDPEADPEQGRSVNAGFSPGDESYPQPYFYVSPWPYPDPEERLPELPTGGHWHREGFTAAILPGERLLAARSVAAPDGAVASHLGRMASAVLELLRD